MNLLNQFPITRNRIISITPFKISLRLIVSSYSMYIVDEYVYCLRYNCNRQATSAYDSVGEKKKKGFERRLT
ncbi:hypothetical protein E2986_11606 [Frieseomelitta varia]|uniref:Uncharacterized protein n=1 Tax=Frieseomelitta varia TaxID=561572 RepID=A0A833VXX2_9HYME|nr:hypothetical protein E2986_11606 [Frieseomelitta varia]